MSIYDSIVITGGGGMLGHALSDALTARRLKSLALTHSQCDVANEVDVRRIFTDHHPTLLLNCAAHTKVDQCERETKSADDINGRAVGMMAKLAGEHRTVLVQVSTDFVFDGTSDRPYRVDDPVSPLSAYGRSKLLGETKLQRHAPPNWLIVRTSWVYGRHGANFPRTMVTVARAGKPLNVVSDQIGSPTYTVDLARGILALLDHGAQGIYHLTNSGQTNWYEFAGETLKQFGINHPVSAITAAGWQKVRPDSAARPKYSVLDTGPFTRLTGQTMPTWQQGLAAFHSEVTANGF